MRRKKGNKTMFFPFSAGVPWSVENGKYIIPYMDSDTWSRAVEGKNLVVTAFGGLLESFVSMCCIEALVSVEPNKHITWLGRPEFLPLLRLQGLCKPSAINLTEEQLEAYPVPLFFDQEHNAYFNVLHGYLTRTSYWGDYPQSVDKPVISQIFSNIMLPWSPEHITKLRNVKDSHIESVKSKTKNNKIILVILDDNTNNKPSTLRWNVQNIRELSAILYGKNYRVVVATNNPFSFHGTKIVTVPKDHNMIFATMRNAHVVLSTTIDWLMISLMISNAAIVVDSCERIPTAFDLFANAEFLGASNVILTDHQSGMSPMDVYALCCSGS